MRTEGVRSTGGVEGQRVQIAGGERSGMYARGVSAGRHLDLWWRRAGGPGCACPSGAWGVKHRQCVWGEGGGSASTWDHARCSLSRCTMAVGWRHVRMVTVWRTTAPGVSSAHTDAAGEGGEQGCHCASVEPPWARAERELGRREGGLGARIGDGGSEEGTGEGSASKTPNRRW